jgi:ATP-binding cassette subfamily F protein uup
VVSHDRYFLERVTDTVWALMGDGQIAMLPRGVDEYLETRRHVADESQKPVETSQMKAQHPGGKTRAKVGGADERSARKTINRIDKQLARITSREVAVTEEMAVNADADRLRELSEEMHRLTDERGHLEEEWLAAAALLE